jgi:hypothetical protein
MQGWRGEQPRTITQLIARAALSVMIGAALIVAVAQMIGTLINVPTLTLRVRSGYSLVDPLRGVWFWNPMGMSSSYAPTLWSNDGAWVARLTPQQLGSPNLTVREAWTGRVVCRIETDLDSLEFAQFFNWDRGEGLLLYSPTAIYHADVNACTLDEILYVEDTINRVSQAQSSLAYIAGLGNQRHAYLLDLTSGDVQQISQTPLEYSPELFAYVAWPFREVAPDQWAYQSDYLLYGDADEFHVYTTATGETQSVYDVDSRMFWGEGSIIISESRYSDQPRLVPITMYAFEDGRLSDQPIFHEPQVYYARDSYNFWLSETGEYFYIAADTATETLSTDTPTRLYRFHSPTRTITPLLPELDRVETVFYGRDGWLFVNQRGVPTTLAYHLPTGEQHMLNARVGPFELWWADDPGTILYITAANQIVRHDLRTGEEQSVAALPTGARVMWGNTAGGYLALVARESSQLQTCVYALEMRGSELRRMHCYAEGDSNFDFFWMEDN